MSEDDRYKPTSVVDFKSGVGLRVLPLALAFLLVNGGNANGLIVPALLASIPLICLTAFLLHRYWKTL